MLKFLNIVFVIFGGIFFLQVIALAYLWFADPFELRPLINSFSGETVTPREVSTTTNSDTSVDTTDKNSNLTPAQEDALEIIGIDPTALPDSITPEQMSCFVRVLGEARVTEIQAGAAPTAIEIFKAKECL